MSDADAAGAALPAETAVGRVGLRVRSIDDLAAFYRDAVGCGIERDGDRARLTAADGRELLVFEAAPDAPPRPRDAAGLFHVAIRLPDRPSLADALARLRDAGARLTGASDHLVSEALYLQDPAGNGLELYRDRPREDWTRLGDARVEMDTLRLDLEDLASAGTDAAVDALPAGTDVGHVHLEVTDLDRSSAFYVDDLGFATSSQYTEGARFVAAGGYHHHVGLNTWNRRRSPVGDHQGLEWFELRVPEAAARERVADRLRARGHAVATLDGTPVVTDPDGIDVRLTAP